jgi:AraC-like DNA-binding protein
MDRQYKGFRILPPSDRVDWPHCHCPRRGDLGSLVAHARSAGYCAERIADSLGICIRTLRAEFQGNYGIPLKKWLIEIRTIEVRKRLVAGERIKEIALSMGFSHGKELSREFRAIHGVTPTEYRKKELQRALFGDKSAGLD